MEPVLIKIKKVATQKNQEIKNALNLNQPPLDSEKTITRKKHSWLIWLFLILALAEAIALGLFFLTKPASPYTKLIPPDAVMTISLKQSSLAELVKMLQANQFSWPLFIWTKDNLKQLEAKTNLKLGPEILSLFQDQMVLVVLPDSSPPVKWLILATKKTTTDNFAAVLTETEKSLKQNFNLVSESYRQTKIIQTKPLNQGSPNIFYAQVKEYFLLTNSLETLKITLDKIID